MDRDRLEEKTDEFFLLHWRADSLGVRPKWNFEWHWQGSVPNYELGGVYALTKADDVVYIGVGTRQGTEQYEDRGLSWRLGSHVLRRVRNDPNRDYEPMEKWQGKIDGLGTIGFPPELNYVASALELYLIQSLKPRYNTIKAK